MDKEQIIEYLYENNVRGDLTIEQMAEDLADRKTESDSEKPNNCEDEQTETQNSNENSNVILVYDGVSEAVRCAMCSNPTKSDRGCDGACSYDEKLYERIMKAIAESVAEDEPQTEMTTEQVVNELLSIKKILDDGKMPKQTHDIRTNTHECVKDTHDKTEPQTVRSNLEPFRVDEPQTERSE